MLGCDDKPFRFVQDGGRQGRNPFNNTTRVTQGDKSFSHGKLGSPTPADQLFGGEE